MIKEGSLIGGMPLLKNMACFATPVFISESSNQLFIQNINAIDNVIGFLEIENSVSTEEMLIYKGECDTVVGKKAIYSFVDFDGQVIANSRATLGVFLKSILSANEVDNILSEEIENFLSESSFATPNSTIHSRNLIVRNSKLWDAESNSIAAYRRYLTEQVFPETQYLDEMQKMSQQKGLLNISAFEVLRLVYQMSRQNKYLSAYQVANVLRKTSGGIGSQAAYKARVSKLVESFCQHGLVDREDVRVNFTNLRPTSKLDDLMHTYFMAFHRFYEQEDLSDLDLRS